MRIPLLIWIIGTGLSVAWWIGVDYFCWYLGKQSRLVPFLRSLGFLGLILGVIGSGIFVVSMVVKKN